MLPWTLRVQPFVWVLKYMLYTVEVKKNFLPEKKKFITQKKKELFLIY